MKMSKYRCRIENWMPKFKLQERCLDSTFIPAWVSLAHMWKPWIWKDKGGEGRVKRGKEEKRGKERRGEGKRGWERREEERRGKSTSMTTPQ